MAGYVFLQETVDSSPALNVVRIGRAGDFNGGTEAALSFLLSFQDRLMEGSGTSTSALTQHVPSLSVP